MDILAEIEQDRRNELRPGIAVAYTILNDKHLLLGSRRSVWTWMFETAAKWKGETIQASAVPDEAWAYNVGIVQGGIKEKETHLHAIVRETIEELGKNWAAEIKVNSLKFLFRDEQLFSVRKDGRTYRGKTLYFFQLEIGIPEDAFDFMFGNHQDEFWRYPTPGFEGGIQFYGGNDSKRMIRNCYKGSKKGRQLLHMVNHLNLRAETW